jgi:phage baseplate assembly protein W
MAFQVQKIHPLDLQPRKAVGIKLPFNKEDVFTLNYSTQEAIKTNIINYFLTGRGERYLNPDFGSSIRNYLFEQITSDTRDLLYFEVERGLTEWFPSVELLDVKVQDDPDNNTVLLQVRYSIRNTNIEDQLVINFG